MTMLRLILWDGDHLIRATEMVGHVAAKIDIEAHARQWASLKEDDHTGLAQPVSVEVCEHLGEYVIEDEVDYDRGKVARLVAAARAAMSYMGPFATSAKRDAVLGQLHDAVNDIT